MMDLNIHSEFSTGNKSVEEIINTSKTHNINAISITDIYSIDSINAIKEKRLQEQLSIIPGIELPSKEYITGYGTEMTILGYGIREDNKKLIQLLEYINNQRNSRIESYYESIQSRFAYLEDKQITIPDTTKYIDIKRFILNQLRKLITIEQFQELERYLILNELKTARPNVETIIRTIKEAGGSPVLKYPSNINTHPITLKLIIYHLKQYGLEGLLVRKDELSHYDEMANRYNLERMTFSKIESTEYKEKLLSKRIK